MLRLVGRRHDVDAGRGLAGRQHGHDVPGVVAGRDHDAAGVLDARVAEDRGVGGVGGEHLDVRLGEARGGRLVRRHHHDLGPVDEFLEERCGDVAVAEDQHVVLEQVEL